MLHDRTGVEDNAMQLNNDVHNLLTQTEKATLNRTVERFQRNKNIGQFVKRLDIILNTPSKKSLWPALMSRLSVDQRDYVMQFADLPLPWTQDKTGSHKPDPNGKRDSKMTPMKSKSAGWDSSSDSLYSSSSSDSDVMSDTEADHLVTGSFKQQLGFLLTSRERQQLINALQIYSEKRNIYRLVDDLSVLLDTRSKRTLWNHVIPLLTTAHQEFCQQVIGLSKAGFAATPQSRTRTFQGQVRRHHSPIKLSATPRRGDVTFDGFSASRQTDRGVESMRFRNSPPGVRATRRANIIATRIPPGGDLDSDSDDGGSSDSGDDMPRFFYGRTSVPESPNVGNQRPNDVTRHKNDNDLLVTQSAAAKRHVLMVRDNQAQTTPPNSPRPLLRQPSFRLKTGSALPWRSATKPVEKIGEFRTIVNLFDDGKRNNSAEILSVYTDKPPSSIGSHPGADRPIHTHTPPVNIPSTVQDKVIKQHTRSRDTSSQSSDVTLITSEWALTDETRDVLRALDEVVDEASLNGEDLVWNKLSPPPPPPPLPPPPPPPAVANTSRLPAALGVKRINWEKLDRIDENTVWAKIQDGDDLQEVVGYLELEQQFSTKKSSISETFKDQRKQDMGILSAKKAYNISILLGHLKKDASDIKKALLILDEEVLTPECLKQLVDFSPDANEMERYDEYRGLLDDLNKSDQFTYQVSRIPGYHQRLKAMLFKANFAEKVEEVKEHLRCLKKASQEIRHSDKLSKILELVLAMGNQLNKGNSRIGDAFGFKISVLSQLDQTKTSDGRSNFMNVLANAVFSRFPEAIDVASDLPTCFDAARVSDKMLLDELSDVRRVLKDISDTISKMGSMKQRAGPTDQFYEVMEHFISRASDEIQNLFSLQVTTIDEFQQVVQYFGENPREITSAEWFNNFAIFVTKFEKAHQYNSAQRVSHVNKQP